MNSASDFINILNKLSPKHVALVCHQNADPDSFGSAYAIKELLIKLYNDLHVSIISPGGLHSTSKRLLENISGIEVTEDFITADVFIMVDVTSFTQLGNIGNNLKYSDIPLMIVDHHEPLEEAVKKAICVISDVTATSTAEIVVEMYRELNVEISRGGALALLTAIIFDSKRFLIASYKTFNAVSYLIRKGGDYNLALSLLSKPVDISERIAKLKGAQRLKLYRIGKWLVVFSSVSTFEASVARALIDLGGDLSIVIGGEKDEIRVSARSTSLFYEETKFHIGKDLMEPLGVFIGGSGGGHSTAAGANGCMNRDKIQDFCISLIASKLGSQFS
ncbi:MAG: DHH family phosphoesterase [Candidatus Methanomethylicia archaeon]|nr:DHH family phosphoesterase [Candidatus Methanomethylicia archaeon]MCX8169032.1 DHH family phosphoesterase [Candidatus Methanomethylicia archaeon]MDW7988764.1 DHH family phosphoesterase [Nitrososphaerota archaeon]